MRNMLLSVLMISLASCENAETFDVANASTFQASYLCGDRLRAKTANGFNLLPSPTVDLPVPYAGLPTLLKSYKILSDADLISYQKDGSSYEFASKETTVAFLGFEGDCGFLFQAQNFHLVPFELAIDGYTSGPRPHSSISQFLFADNTEANPDLNSAFVVKVTYETLRSEFNFADFLIGGQKLLGSSADERGYIVPIQLKE